MTDAEFLAGTFFEYDVPKEKRFLLKYFNNDLQLAFLRYYLTTGKVWNFTDHTGHYCSRRFAYVLAKRCDVILRLHEEARRGLTEEAMEMLQKIESGKLRFAHLPKNDCQGRST